MMWVLTANTGLTYLENPGKECFESVDRGKRERKEGGYLFKEQVSYIIVLLLFFLLRGQ